MSRSAYFCKNGRCYKYKPLPIKFITNAHCPEQEMVRFSTGNPVYVNNIVPDCKARECLVHLYIKYEAEFVTPLGFTIECDDIEFKCMSPNADKPTKNKIQACLKNMQKGKCPYKLARQIFTNIPNKKSR